MTSHGSTPNAPSGSVSGSGSVSSPMTQGMDEMDVDCPTRAASANRNYNFQFSCNRHEQQDVFQGSTKKILPYSQEDKSDVDCVMWRNEPKKITTIYFSDEQDKQNYLRWAEEMRSAYKPDLKFSNDAVFGIGRLAGFPIKKWVGKRELQLWQCDHSRYIRAGSDLRRLGKWLGAAVYDVHLAGKFVGDLLNSAYVDEVAQRVSFIKRDTLAHQNMDVVAGIQQDLQQLVDFVNAALKTCPHTPHPGSDVDMFRVLHQEILNQRPTTLNDMQLMSYFLCHTPLYWDSVQRQSFYYTYWSLRQSDEYQFDTEMLYTGSTAIANTWYRDLSKLPQPFTDVFDYFNLKRFINYTKGTRMVHLLIPFHRNCMEHVNKQSQVRRYTCAEVDEYLFNVFPDAIPKAYVEFFKMRAGFTLIQKPFTLKEKCESLRDGIFCSLDYSKFIKVIPFIQLITPYLDEFAITLKSAITYWWK